MKWCTGSLSRLLVTGLTVESWSTSRPNNFTRKDSKKIISWTFMTYGNTSTRRCRTTERTLSRSIAKTSSYRLISAASTKLTRSNYWKKNFRMWFLMRLSHKNREGKLSCSSKCWKQDQSNRRWERISWADIIRTRLLYRAIRLRPKETSSMSAN